MTNYVKRATVDIGEKTVPVDAAGRLVKIKNDTGSVLETYTFEASRERLMTENSGGRTYYAWGGSSPVIKYTEPTTNSTSPIYYRVVLKIDFLTARTAESFTRNARKSSNISSLQLL